VSPATCLKQQNISEDNNTGTGINYNLKQLDLIIVKPFFTESSPIRVNKGMYSIVLITIVEDYIKRGQIQGLSRNGDSWHY
jgi:hypothetical protein